MTHEPIQPAPRTEAGAPLTLDELDLLEKTTSQDDWTAAVNLILNRRNGISPSDWHEKVLASGLLQRMQTAWTLAREERPKSYVRIRPINRQVALDVAQEAMEKTDGGIVIPGDDGHIGKIVEAKVLAVADDIPLAGDPPQPALKEGDLVLIHRTAGQVRRLPDGRQIRFVEFGNLKAILEPITAAEAAANQPA